MPLSALSCRDPDVAVASLLGVCGTPVCEACPVTTSSNAAEQPSPAGRGSAARWAARIAVLLVVLLLLTALVGYAYPWLVFYGVIG